MHIDFVHHQTVHIIMPGVADNSLITLSMKI